MQNRRLLILTIAAVSSIPLMAQQGGANPHATSPQTPSSQPGSPQTSSPLPENSSPQTSSPQTNASPASVSSTANSPDSNLELRPVSGELESKLDTKSAKAGDSVVVKTTVMATTADGVVIPKGSKIVGHVTDVEARGKSSDNSRVTIQFDQAELKGGQTLPIRSVIQSVAPEAVDPAAPGSGDLYGGSSAAQPAAGGMNGGASTGGASGSSNPGQASTRTSPTSGAPVAGQVTGQGPVAGQSSATTQENGGAPAVGTVVARNGNVAIRTTAIPGVLLANNSDGQPFANASGALLGAKRDVHLDSGTHLVVALAEKGAKSSR